MAQQKKKKAPRIHIDSTPKKPMSTVVYQTSHKPNFRCGQRHTTT